MSAIDGWTRKLPQHWRTKPLKAVASYMVSNVDKVPADKELPVRLCNYTDVYNNEFISSAMDLMRTTATATEIEKFRLLKNDVVITKDSESWDDIAIPSLLVDTADDLLCGYHLAILRPKPEELNGRFLFRCLQSKSIRLQLELSSTGVTRFGLPKGEIGKMLLPVASMDEQQRIADYLDRETAQIDALIKEKQRMLALLDEKRTALISRAVTRGLDLDASFKPSGLQWLGDIPVHWETIQLKRTWLSAEYGISENIRDEGFIKVLRMTCIVDGKIDLTKAGEVEEVDQSLLLQKGDLLFNRTNSLDQVAKVGLLDIEPDVPTSFASYLVRIRTNERTSGEYLAYLLNSSIFLEFARKNAIPAIGQANLNPTRYGEICIPLPPRQEQDEIVSAITRERERTAEMESALVLSIALLKERRSALITAAVTGQIEPEAMNP